MANSNKDKWPKQRMDALILTIVLSNRFYNPFKVLMEDTQNKISIIYF